MAKKVRRARKNRYNADGEAAVSNSNGIDTKSKPDAAERFQLEYAYVLKDLRHILILAGVMFLLLIALNIFMR